MTLDGEQEKKEEGETPQNGDMKKEEKETVEEKKAEAAEEQPQEEEENPPKRTPRFWERFFRRGQDNKQDVEAGTELLSKANVKQPGDEDKNNMAEERVADSKRVYWRRVAISLVCIMIVLVVVTVVSVITSSGHSARGPLGEPLAVTDCGPVRGYKADGIYVFRGIPYALPPVGELRWKPPVHPSSLNDCWTGTYEAFNSSAICYQKSIPGENVEVSEDCLYLDIITPSLSPPVLRPVVVYIPGDYPVRGYTADDIRWRPTTDIADTKDVTFVTIQYRTNVFGYMVLDLLTDRMRPPTSGNYGLMDMLAALRWVQRNIRSFGGDPDKVTVLAHGGAATAGIALLSSKKSDSLFSQMWLTAPSTRFSNRTLKDISQENSLFQTKLNCDSLPCMYNKSSEEVLAAMPGFWSADWSLDVPSAEEEQSPTMVVVDGNILYNTPFHMWREGDIQQVPIVIGSAAQESGSSKKMHDLARWSWTDFSDYVSEKLETLSDNVTVTSLQFYIQNNTTPQQQFHSIVSDVRTICPLERLNEALAEVLQADSFWYLVDYVPSAPIQFSNESAPVRLSVHGMDIAAIFGLLDNYIKPMSTSDETFQKNLQDLFYSFVHGGRPEIRGEVLMSSNFINMIGESVRSRMTPYENCHIWKDDIFYSHYAKMN